MKETKLVGISEIAAMATPPVTKQAVSNWRLRYDDFPKPAQTLQSGPVWDSEVIAEWLQAKAGHLPVVISFINLKGGVAKTTTSVAVAEILAKTFRKNVLFIDLDPQTNATINLIGEDEWLKRNSDGRTLAQLFRDKLRPDAPQIFDLDKAIVQRGVSKVDGGISRLSLLPSSIDFIEIQEELPFVAMKGNFNTNPQDILRRTLVPVIDRYDFVIIDCPPSLGIVTKNGLRFSTHYIIPTIPDIVSTWGIFQIVSSISAFAEDVNRTIRPLGIVATKVNGHNTLHERVRKSLQEGRLFAGKDTDLKQPPLFMNYVKEATDMARGADFTANIVTLKHKYGATNTDPLIGLTKEILEKCHQPRS